MAESNCSFLIRGVLFNNKKYSLQNMANLHLQCSQVKWQDYYSKNSMISHDFTVGMSYDQINTAFSF